MVRTLNLLNHQRVTCSATRWLGIVCWILFGLVGTGWAQQADIEERSYSKREVRIAMRDNVELHTTIYSPTDTSRQYPILLQRTPYGCGPYGEQMPESVMYNSYLVKSGYIFVYQDLRSRSMSDGEPEFENLKPVYSATDPTRTDEVTDSQDTIDWLLKNVEGHNANVGMFGSSYMGYTSLMGAVTGHPNLKAVMSAAPSVDLFFEDFNRNGLFTLAYMPILDWFGTPKTDREEGPWWKNNLSYWADEKRFGLAHDSYGFFLNKGALSNYGDLVSDENYFWQAIKQHPNYDDYRKRRNVLQYLNGIKCPVLIVGGWNDEQNMYGILNSYRQIKRYNPDCDCRLVIGPWAHSEHKRPTPQCYIGNVYFGEDLVDEYQHRSEFKFFEHHLKRAVAEYAIPSALIFDTGSKEWLEGASLEKIGTSSKRYFLNSEFGLTEAVPEKDIFELEFISDPSKPVPYVESDQFNMFPAKQFMTADQRFASKRPDVLTFMSRPLSEEICFSGAMQAVLQFSTDQTAADLIVKLIDVYPMDRAAEAPDKPNLKMNGYQQLVRCGQIRGRFRDGYENPIPFSKGEVTEVPVELLDVCHTFKRGHRVMIQIQSSLFPLFDRNPQVYVPNIYEADDTDFVKATHRIHAGSYFEFTVRSGTRGSK